MEKIKIFGIGVSGLVGSRIVELLQDTYQIDNLSLDTGVNITDPKTLDVIRNDKDHAAVLHLAAKADVDGCEKDKDLGKEGAAYQINVAGTQNVVDACKESNKKIIYISTDFVFNGEQTPDGGYTEEDTPHPINWYAQTKYEGEEVVRNAGLPFVVARLAYPYQSKDFALKKDFVHAIMNRFANNQQVLAVKDHIMSPTYLDDFAMALGLLLPKDVTGIYHVTGSQSLSPFDAAGMIAEQFSFDKSLIHESTRQEYFKDKAARPFNLSINNAKIKKLGATLRTFEEGLKEVSKV